VHASSSQGTPAEQMNQITTDLLQMFYSQLTQQQQQATTTGATLAVQRLMYHPPGAEQPLLNDVSFTLPANTMGLLIGRSGSGKTTLLQVCSGLLCCHQSGATRGQARDLRAGPRRVCAADIR
jgi:ABC-type protease/lipase transport system fused ATPase/permease subunit